MEKRIIGVTGGVGAGKSRVLKILAGDFGAHVIQADEVAKALMEREKLNEEQFNTIMAGGTLPPCEDAKPEQAQPDQTVQPAPVQPAEPAETAERAEPAEQAEPAQPEMPQPDAPEQQD